MVLNLDKEQDEIEMAVGKFPKGVCLCEAEDGRPAIIHTSETDEEEFEKFVEKLQYSIFIQPISTPDLREKCTGNYKKIGE